MRNDNSRVSYSVDRSLLKKQARLLMDGKTFVMIRYYILYLLIVVVCGVLCFLCPNPVEEFLLAANPLTSELFYDNACRSIASGSGLFYVIAGVGFIFLRFLLFNAIIYPFTVCWNVVPLCVAEQKDITFAAIRQPISRSRWFVEYLISGAMQFALVFLWGVLLFVPGVIASYSYEFAPFIFIKNGDSTAGECLKTSKDLSRGFKASLFSRDLSFLGWLLVGICTCGVILFYSECYRAVLKALYFETICKAKTPPMNNAQ